MKAKRILLLLLSLILLFTSVLIPTVYASGTDTDYDYSREGSYFNTVFTAADMLSLLGTDVLGAELSDGERAYLEKYSTLSVKYERIATTQDISVVTVDDITRVTAGTYTYAGSNGATVTWIPVESTVGDTVAAMTLKDGTYVAEFAGITLTDDASVAEAAGHKITLIEGERQNIKITTPSDMTIAETFIASEENDTQL